MVRLTSFLLRSFADSSRVLTEFDLSTTDDATDSQTASFSSSPASRPSRPALTGAAGSTGASGKPGPTNSGGGNNARPSSSNSASNPSPSSSGGSTDPFASACLAAHNDFRATHHADPLTWNDTLAAAAEKWTKNCVWEHSGGKVGPVRAAQPLSPGGLADEGICVVRREPVHGRPSRSERSTGPKTRNRILVRLLLDRFSLLLTPLATGTTRRRCTTTTTRVLRTIPVTFVPLPLSSTRSTAEQLALRSSRRRSGKRQLSSGATTASATASCKADNWACVSVIPPPTAAEADSGGIPRVSWFARSV